MKRKHAPRPVRGYTLMELIITTPLMTLLMLGMGSAILIARNSIPDGKSTTSAPLQASAALEQLAFELSYATSISSRSATSIVFVTPDRSGGGGPETIQYQWSGVAGAPLTRIVNGSPAENVVASVQQFSLTYNAAVDPVLGSLVKTISVRLIAPAGTTAPIDMAIETINQPQLP